MNRMQWLQVWGLSPVMPRDRRRQSSSSVPSNCSEAFAAFMRRVSDRFEVAAVTRETVEV
jgi:hypothetical protein